MYNIRVGQENGDNQKTHNLWKYNQGSNTWSYDGQVNIYSDDLGARLHNMPSAGIMVYLQPIAENQ